MMSPVELALGRLTGFCMRALLTNAHAVHERAEDREKPEAEDDDANVPNLRRNGTLSTRSRLASENWGYSQMWGRAAAAL